MFFVKTGGTYVPDIDQTEAEQAFDILAQLEAYSARLASQRITTAELANLREIQKRFDNFTKDDTDGSLDALEINNQFHQAIHLASGNELLQELINKTTGVTFNMYAKHHIAGNTETSSQEHWHIIEALEKGIQTMSPYLCNCTWNLSGVYIGIIGITVKSTSFCKLISRTCFPQNLLTYSLVAGTDMGCNSGGRHEK